MLICQKNILWKSSIYHSIKLLFDAEVAEIILNVIYYLDPQRPNGYLVAAWIITGEFLLIGLSIVGFVCLRRFKRREDWNNKKNLHNYLQGHLNI